MITSIEEAIRRIVSVPELSSKLAYDHFSTPQALPFATYSFDFDTGGADDYSGVQWINFTLELYADPRDIALERKILNSLDDVIIRSSSDYIESERMYQTTFRFRFPDKLTNKNP